MNRQIVEGILQENRDNYNLIASEFDKSRKEMWPEVVEIAKSVSPFSMVLDAGCGNGRLFPYIKKKGANYLGFDESEELIKICKKRYGDKFFFVANVLNIENHESKIMNQEFDWVFYLAVLHHLPTMELRVRAICNLKQLLRPNGKLVITVWNIWQMKYLKYIAKAAFNKLIGQSKLDWKDCYIPFKTHNRYVHAFTMAELKQLIVKVGMKIEETEKTKGNYLLVANK